MRYGLSLTCLSLLLAACFDPDGGGEDLTESSSGSGSGTTTDSPTSTTDSPTTATPDPDSDSSGPPTSDGTVDEPPTVELLVNGSATPPDMSNAGRMMLTADAVDDGTVARVDFYANDMLFASDETEPFEAEIVLTSLDNGDYSLSAIAVDDADQQGESRLVTLAVDITGGDTVADDTNLFQMGGIPFHPGIGAVHDADGNVIVAGSLSTTGFEVTGLGVTSLSPDLSATNWQISVPESLVDGEPQFLTLGQPCLSSDGSELLIGGNAMGTDGVIDNNASVFRVAADGSGALPFWEFTSDDAVQNIPVPGIDISPDGDVFLAGPDDNISKLDPSDGSVVWQSPVGMPWNTGDYGGHRLRVNDEGDVIFDLFTCGPMGNCVLSTRKINGFDGTQLWAEQLPAGDNSFFMHVGGSAPGPDGRVLTLRGPTVEEGGGLHMVLRDDNGTTLQDMMLGSDGNRYSIADLRYDLQGQVVVVGTVLEGGDTDSRQAFAARISESGDVLWLRTFGFGASDDQAMALALDREGRVVVVGIADISAFIVFLGNVWVAQLDL